MSEYILGETRDETARLQAQAARHPVGERLRWAGLGSGQTVVDAGCGPGELSRIAAELVGPTGRVLGFDRSEVRLEEARARPPPAGAGALEFLTGDVLAPPVPPGSADFVLCHYVLEHVPNRPAAVAALAALLRPGGTLCLCDADHVGNIMWPVSPELERGLQTVRAALLEAGIDAHAGRKLFSLARDAGLVNLEVRAEAIGYAGEAPEAEVDGWRQRLVALSGAGIGALGEAAWRRFAEAYLHALRDPGCYRYDVFITVRGTRA